MRRFAPSIAAILLCLGVYCLNGIDIPHFKTAHAQVPMTGAGVGAPVVAASYQGPGDVDTGAVAFWSCGRAYSNAYATGGSPQLCLIYGTTTTTTCILSAHASGALQGFADTSTATPCVGGTITVGTFCNGVTNATCQVQEAYDQTGNGYNASQSNTALQPIFRLNIQNSLPCMYGTAANQNLETSTAITTASPYTFTAVAERATNSTTQMIFMYTGSGGFNMQFNTLTDTIRVNFGSGVNNTGAVEAAMNAAVASSASSPNFAVYNTANGTTNVTTSSGTSSLAGDFYIVGNTAAGLDTGYFCEGGIWPSALTYAPMIANMHSATVGWNF